MGGELSEGQGAVPQQDPTEQPREISSSSLMYPVLLRRLGNSLGHTCNSLGGVCLVVLWRMPWCPLPTYQALTHLPRV